MDPRLRSWLSPVKSDATKAWCLLCSVEILAHHKTLLRHSRSTKHVSLVQGLVKHSATEIRLVTSHPRKTVSSMTKTAPKSSSVVLSLSSAVASPHDLLKNGSVVPYPTMLTAVEHQYNQGSPTKTPVLVPSSPSATARSTMQVADLSQSPSSSTQITGSRTKVSIAKDCTGTAGHHVLDVSLPSNPESVGSRLSSNADFSVKLGPVRQIESTSSKAVTTLVGSIVLKDSEVSNKSPVVMSNALRKSSESVELTGSKISGISIISPRLTVTNHLERSQNSPGLINVSGKAVNSTITSCSSEVTSLSLECDCIGSSPVGVKLRGGSMGVGLKREREPGEAVDMLKGNKIRKVVAVERIIRRPQNSDQPYEEGVANSCKSHTIDANAEFFAENRFEITSDVVVQPVKDLKKGTWSQYKKCYRREWELHPLLKDWITSVPGVQSQARCKVCNCTIRAHLADLRHHAETSKHRNALLWLQHPEEEGEGVYDPDFVPPGKGGGKKGEGRRGRKKKMTVAAGDSNEQAHTSSSCALNSNQKYDNNNEGGQSSWYKYRKRYRTQWEKDPQFQGWLGSVPGDDTRGRCIYCRVVLRAHYNDLRHHARTTKHANNIAFGQPYYSEEGEGRLGSAEGGGGGGLGGRKAVYRRRTKMSSKLRTHPSASLLASSSCSSSLVDIDLMTPDDTLASIDTLANLTSFLWSSTQPPETTLILPRATHLDASLVACLPTYLSPGAKFRVRKESQDGQLQQQLQQRQQQTIKLLQQRQREQIGIEEQRQQQLRQQVQQLKRQRQMLSRGNMGVVNQEHNSNIENPQAQRQQEQQQPQQLTSFGERSSPTHPTSKTGTPHNQQGAGGGDVLEGGCEGEGDMMPFSAEGQERVEGGEINLEGGVGEVEEGGGGEVVFITCDNIDQETIDNLMSQYPGCMFIDSNNL